MKDKTPQKFIVNDTPSQILQKLTLQIGTLRTFSFYEYKMALLHLEPLDHVYESVKIVCINPLNRWVVAINVIKHIHFF